MANQRQLEINIPGDPVAKGRPRFGQGRAYTPAKTLAFEQRVAWAAKLAMKGTPPWEGPLEAVFVFWLREPKRGVGLYPMGRPDLDNLIKGVCDACNKIVWDDDAQIVSLHAEKKYSDAPGILLLVGAA